MKKIIKILIIVAILIIISVIIIKVIPKKEQKIVCLDPGHGGNDVGAVFGDRYEKDDTLHIAQLIKKYLEEQDIVVIITRDKDKTTSLYERCKIANKKNAELFVSIHRNASDEDANGIEIWINSKQRENDMELANSILDKLNDTEYQTNRGIKSGTIKGQNTDYYVLNNTKMPSCLIELGFITDDKDNELFDKNIEDYAKAIASGIIEEIKVEN